MAFTVGWDGLSLVGVEYADQFFADRAVAAWPNGQVAAKQAALARATDYVRAMFVARMDPALVGPDTLPEQLLRAVCLYALVELATPGGLAPAPKVDDSGYSVAMTRKKTGPLERQYEVVGGGAQPGARRKFPVADALIASLLLATPPLTRVIR